MKKILSIMLAMAMVLSVVIIAAVPAAAVEGDWTVVAQAKQEKGEISEAEYNSVAGYKYDEEGFHVIATNWKGQTPWARFVSKEKVDLKEGVYMEIRIDEFDYVNPDDSWFNVMLTDDQLVTPPEKHEGEGAQSLLRPYSPTLYTTTWYTTNTFKQTAVGKHSDIPIVTDENGKQVLTVEIAWDGTTYTYTINGVSTSTDVIDYMNDKWGGENSETYVGFCLQHNAKDGKVACTLLKYGTSADDATVPYGDDSVSPKDYSVDFAPVVENPTFESGKPGIFMNGDVEESDIRSIPQPGLGELISVNEDGTMKIVASNEACPTGTWYVKNSTSYAIEDLPIAMMVTRNLCTCSEEDLADNNGICYASEESTVYLMTGDQLTAGGNCMTYAEVSWDAYVVGDDTYLSIMLDASEVVGDSEEALFSGRINGIRFDIKDVAYNVPGANTFDVCFVAFFATVEDANAFFEAYLTNLGWEDPDAGEEETTEDETTAAGEDETTAAGEDETTVAGEDETTVAGGNNSGSTDTPAKKGCKGVVGFGAVAVVAVATVAGFVSFKKKED